MHAFWQKKIHTVNIRTTFEMTPHLTCWLWGDFAAFFAAVNLNLFCRAGTHVTKRCTRVAIETEIDWLSQQVGPRN